MFDVYQKNGGFAAFKDSVTKKKPNEVTDVVKNSGLRGRGGAGFPTGMKWSFIDNKNCRIIHGRIQHLIICRDQRG